MDLDRSNIWPGKLGGSGTVAEIIVDGEDERRLRLVNNLRLKKRLQRKALNRPGASWPGTVQVTI